MKTISITFTEFLASSFGKINPNERILKMAKNLTEAFTNYYLSEAYAALDLNDRRFVVMIHNDVNYLLLSISEALISSSEEVEVWGQIQDECESYPGFFKVSTLLSQVLDDHLAFEQTEGVLPEISLFNDMKALIVGLLYKVLQVQIEMLFDQHKIATDGKLALSDN
jgi:hypothetical protein